MALRYAYTRWCEIPLDGLHESAQLEARGGTLSLSS